MNINRRTLLGAGGAGLLGALGLFGGGRRSEAAVARFPLTHSDGEWQRLLTPPQYEVLRRAGTERAGSSPLDREHRPGTFLCAGCANPLFSSKTKFDSGTGWPSFWKPLPAAIATRTDGVMFMTRTEVLCRRCGGHLGHVFDDGPRPTGLRYCMNGVAMKFRPA